MGCGILVGTLPDTQSGGRRPEEVGMEQTDERVHDADVIAEIRLTGDVMIAASEHEGPLSQGEIDTVLGLG